MKRELKECSFSLCPVDLQYRKAHPDEKGTESGSSLVMGDGTLKNRKAHPDEKGTERYFANFKS